MKDLEKRKASEYTTEGGFSLADDLEVGQWYWHSCTEEVWDEESEDYTEKGFRYLACITHVGSNFARVTYVNGNSSRVHFDTFFEVCQPELNWQQVINDRVLKLQQELQEKLQEATDLYGGLSLGSTVQADHGTQALARVSDTSTGMSQYKKALRDAKENKLPAIFEETKQLQGRLGRWMAAPYLPLKGKAEELRDDLSLIDHRLWAVDLYAGLSEEVEPIVKGKPAPASEKVYVYQRMRYMDEESLLYYNNGGLEFKNLDAFDKWLAQHRDQFFPNPKCVVAFRVRREKKRREAHNIADVLRIAQLAKKDELTYLYIRNGENLYRLSTENKFGPQIFPDFESNVFSRGEPLYWKNGKSFVTEGEMLEIQEAEKKSSWPTEFHKFDDSSIYFDDMTAAVTRFLWEHNRVALILQGVFDRSRIFQPHGKVVLSNPEGFAAALELVYDASKALSPSDRPDFEAYRAELNSSLKVGCIVTGFYEHWHEEALDKHGEYLSSSSYGTRVLPYYIKHPPRVARVAKIYPRKKEVLIEWQRKAATGVFPRKMIRAAFRVPISELLNISAYKRGDFKQFYKDPNTRVDYLQWAPLLLTAERTTFAIEQAEKSGTELVLNSWVMDLDDLREAVEWEKDRWSWERFYTPEGAETYYLATRETRSREPVADIQALLSDETGKVAGGWTHIVIEKPKPTRKKR